MDRPYCTATAAMDATAVPFMVLKSRMAVHALGFKPWRKERAAVTFTPGKDWTRIDCHRKEASGCGDHGGKLLEGLTLYVRGAERADLTSSMCICLSDEARRSIEAEFGGVPPGAVGAEAGIKIATEQLLVVIVVFRIIHHSERVYYLVYDATDASLRMVPYVPPGVVASYTATPVPRFTGAGRDYELVLLARKFLPQRVNRELVCVCAPAPGVWEVKVRHFPEIPYAFSADEMFAFQGKLFWADLYQGALCLVLANMRLRRRTIRGFVEESDYIYSFDMRSKRPLWFGLVRDYSTIEPVILPCSFFGPPPTRKRKLSSESSTPSDPK